MTDAKALLRDLERLPWSSFPSEYGQAARIPKLVRGVVEDGRGSPQNAALDDLFQHLCHQHTVSPAAELAVPVLVALVTAVPHPVSADLIDLVGHCAQASRRWDGHVSKPSDSDGPVRVAVLGQLPLLQLSAERSIEIRPTVAAVVGGYLDLAQPFGGAIERWWAESKTGDDHFVFALSLAMLGRRDDRIARALTVRPFGWEEDLYGHLLDRLVVGHDPPELHDKVSIGRAVLEAAWSIRH